LQDPNPRGWRAVRRRDPESGPAATTTENGQGRKAGSGFDRSVPGCSRGREPRNHETRRDLAAELRTLPSFPRHSRTRKQIMVARPPIAGTTATGQIDPDAHHEAVRARSNLRAEVTGRKVRRRRWAGRISAGGPIWPSQHRPDGDPGTPEVFRPGRWFREPHRMSTQRLEKRPLEPGTKKKKLAARFFEGYQHSPFHGGCYRVIAVWDPGTGFNRVRATVARSPRSWDLMS